MKATKRILSVLLAVILAMSAVVTATAEIAEDDYKPIYQIGGDKADLTYRELVFEALHWHDTWEMYSYNYICGYNADGSTADEGALPDYIVCFASSGDPATAPCREIIGNYVIDSLSTFSPDNLGYYIYSTTDAKVYTIKDAYKADLPNVEFALSILGEKEYMYRDVFKNYIDEVYLEYGEEYWFFDYKELYSYYAEDVTAIEATPDYLLVYGHSDVAPSYSYGIFGDYIVHTGYYYPDNLPYYVITQKGTVLTLREAWESKLEGIENVFTDYGLGKMLGDMDNDRRLTVKDATYIQKCLVGLMEFPVEDEVRGIPEVYDDSPDENVRYISDFDGDDKRTIKDATAIQKHIAGIVDTPDEPEYKIPEDALFEENCIIVSTDNADGENFTLEDFSEYEFVSMEKYEFLAREGAMYTLYLKNPGKESVEAAVNALLYRVGRDLSAVHPNWYAVAC